MQRVAAVALEPAQPEPALLSGTLDDMASPGIISGEQLPAVRAERGLHVPDLVDSPGLVVFLSVMSGNDHSIHLLAR